jgi:23S rRNA (adenine2503-C2)-methyltransferase
MLAGINDSVRQAQALAELALSARAKVNLIPYNKARGAFERPSREAIKAFENMLKTRRVPVTVRVEKGSDSQAACGQLRGARLDKKKGN